MFRSTFLGCAALVLLAAGAGAARAATPSHLTLTPGGGGASFQTALIGGANNDPSTCQEGVSCDTVVVDVAAGDWRGTNLKVAIDWTVPASDFDLYVFHDQLNGETAGASTGGAPETHEQVTLTLNAVLASPRRYLLHVVAFAAAPERVQGTLSLVAPPAPRVAHLSPLGVTFSPNVTVSAPGTARDCEPSLRVDVRGNCYVGGIRGVPGGVDLWRFDLDPTSATYDPQLRAPAYLGQPDAFAAQDTTGGRDGGGDIDIATGFPTNAAEVPALTIVSLASADVSSATSSDRGANFTLHPAVATAPSDDRQWEEADGDSTVYLFYRGLVPNTSLFVERSTDHGATFPQTALVSPTGTSPDYIDVDHRDGTIYVAHSNSSAMLVSRSSDGGVTWTTRTVDNSTGHHNLFDPIKVGDDGTVYAAWSDGAGIRLAHSTDHGDTWSAPVQVSGDESRIALFPWLEAGSAGRVVVVWIGTNSTVDSDAADWRIYSAITTNATATDPNLEIAEVSDHVVHASNISLGGLQVPTPVTPVPNRNLCDYFQVAVDPLGACVVAFTDDHNDFDGNTFLARQLGGPSLYASANGGTGVLASENPIPLPQPDPSQPQLTDFLHDATGSSLQPIPGDNPFDLLSVRYGCSVQGAAALLEVRLAVSSLAAVPPNTFWRAYFTLNAPNGTPDRGESFYVQAATDGSGTPAFTFGSVARDSGGSLVTTPIGPATGGELDPGTNEVVVRLAPGTLNPYVHGATFQPGSVLTGLKASTGQSTESAARDFTRGGGPWTFCSQALAVSPPEPGRFGMSAPRPNPGRGGSSVDLTLSQPAWVDLGVFDAGGRRVRTVRAGVLPAGVTRCAWDGRTDAGHAASPGVYYLRMLAGGAARSERLILVR